MTDEKPTLEDRLEVVTTERKHTAVVFGLFTSGLLVFVWKVTKSLYVWLAFVIGAASAIGLYFMLH